MSTPYRKDHPAEPPYPPLPEAPSVPWASNGYMAQLNAGTDAGRYRQTPAGQPTVADLVKPGTSIATSYGTGGIVISVEGHEYFRGVDGQIRKTWTVTFVPERKWPSRRETDHCWINECVAVDGRILMLFENNDDEVLIKSTELVALVEQQRLAAEPSQLSLF